MREFDFEVAKSGKPVRTRDGRKARIICTDRVGTTYPVVALVTQKGGYEGLMTFTTGGCLHSPESPTDYDLVMETVRREGWVNVVRFGQECNVGCLYRTKEDALRHVDAGGNGYVATVRIEWEE